MANDWTSTRIPFDAGRRDIMVMRPETTQKVAYTGTHGVISNPVGSQIIRVWCSTDAFIKIGASPTADGDSVPVTAKCAEYFLVTNPGVSKVSAVQQAAGGTLHVTECL